MAYNTSTWSSVELDTITSTLDSAAVGWYLEQNELVVDAIDEEFVDQVIEAATGDDVFSAPAESTPNSIELNANEVLGRLIPQPTDDRTVGVVEYDASEWSARQIADVTRQLDRRSIGWHLVLVVSEEVEALVDDIVESVTGERPG